MRNTKLSRDPAILRERSSSHISRARTSSLGSWGNSKRKTGQTLRNTGHLSFSGATQFDPRYSPLTSFTNERGLLSNTPKAKAAPCAPLSVRGRPGSY